MRCRGTRSAQPRHPRSSTSLLLLLGLVVHAAGSWLATGYAGWRGRCRRDKRLASAVCFEVSAWTLNRPGEVWDFGPSFNS